MLNDIVRDRKDVFLDLDKQTWAISRLGDGGITFKTSAGTDPVTHTEDTLMPDGVPGTQATETWSDGICVQRHRGSMGDARRDYLLGLFKPADPEEREANNSRLADASTRASS